VGNLARAGRSWMCSPGACLVAADPSQRPIQLADFGVAHRQRVNEGLSADDIVRGYSVTLGPELVQRRGDEAGGLDGHASDAWALGAVLCMLLARNATLSHSALTTHLDRGPASGSTTGTAFSVGERQRRLYHLVFPANVVPLHLQRESRFAPLIVLAERLLRRDPAQRPPPNAVIESLLEKEAFLAGIHLTGALGWRVTGRHLSPSDDVREAWAGRSTPWWLRWCVRSQLYWAHVFFNPEAAWRREACIARGVVLSWAACTWVYFASYSFEYQSRETCILLLLGLGIPGYCIWSQVVCPYGMRSTSSWVTLAFWLVQIGLPVGVPLALAIQTQAAGFPLCVVLGVVLCPLWQALVTWLPPECRLLAVLSPSTASGETATPAAHAVNSEGSWWWGRLDLPPRSKPYPTLEYPTEAALRSEVAALQDLARTGGAPPACTLTARDACDRVGTFRLVLTIEVEPLAAVVARPGAYTSWEAWLWLHQAAGALAYLHGRGTHHGNINLESVLITSAPHGRQVRLCRFGQAPDTSTAFASPEKADFVAAGQGGGAYDEAAADVWSLGVLVIALLSRQPPPPSDGLRRLGVTVAAEDEVLECRRRDVAKLCGLWREGDVCAAPEWNARSRFVPFIQLAECALRLLPSQRVSAAEAERYISVSSPFVWRTHGAGVFRVSSLRRRWRDDLVDLLSPSATGLVLRQAVKVQVFWALTLSDAPEHAHLRGAFDRVMYPTGAYLLAALALAPADIALSVVEGSVPRPSGLFWASLPLMLATPDADQVWMCASPRLVRAVLFRYRNFNARQRVEVKYLAVLVIRLFASVKGCSPPAWLWPALGAVVVAKILMVVGCALLWVHSARYVGSPQPRHVGAVGEGQQVGAELEGAGLSLLEHAV
jgi:serine/threonine protein kinase